MEAHPLRPFLPDGCRLLMLGSFPPARKRWCMEFFYPNFQNDMWRIVGLACFGDRLLFVDEEHRTFRLEAIKTFLNERGIGLYDTACEVIRTRETASDKDLQVVRQTDLAALLDRLPACQALCTTGEKATGIVCEQFHIEPQPKTGEHTTFDFGSRSLRLYRMPSSSRAYPLALDKKAERYRAMFNDLEINRNQL